MPQAEPEKTTVDAVDQLNAIDLLTDRADRAASLLSVLIQGMADVEEDNGEIPYSSADLAQTLRVVLDMCREMGPPIRLLDKERLARVTGGKLQ